MVQPFHNASIAKEGITEFKGRTDDMGGNFFPLGGKPYFDYNKKEIKANLHRYLDGVARDPQFYIFRDGLNGARYHLNDKFRGKLLFIVDELLKKPKKFTVKDYDLKEINQLKTWMNDAYDIAVDEFYKNEKITLNGEITSEFETTVRELMRERITLAGYRLASELNKFYHIYDKCTKQQRKLKIK